MDFSYDGLVWQARVPLPAWSDFTKTEAVPLIFAPEGWSDAAMGPEHMALARWVPEHHARQKPILLDAVLRDYPRYRREFFEGYDIEDNEEDLPTITTTGGLSRVMKLIEVTVHQISPDGVPYVGYQFKCAWEEEHGLGVLMHGDRIVELGGADSAFLLWIAENDLKRQTGAAPAKGGR